MHGATSFSSICNTINSLMMEQENAIVGNSDSGEATRLKEKNNELQAKLETTTAELEAISGDHNQLKEHYKQLSAKLKQQQLSSQDSLGLSQVSNQSEKLDRYRTAAKKQIEVLQLRYTKAESKIASLENELRGKTEENAKLTQISDSLIAMLEAANLS